MAQRCLVIVESPTKARTIKAFLPKGFTVEASVGHIRDLPKSAKEIPADVKDQPWSRVGIDVENDFRPLYIVPADKKKQVAKLRKLVKEAEVLYLATDEDREGESISWHLVEVLNPKVPQHRLVFHEITKTAIQNALDNPRDLDIRLVKAQEARRILDRLYGYEVSPILWRKVGPRLSAGRVQSVAIRLVVMRERERSAFVRSTFWDLTAQFQTERAELFDAQLVTLDGKRIASGKDFDSKTGELKADSQALHLSSERAAELSKQLASSAWKVSKVEKKPYTERPAAPFTTSTLQQESNRKLRLSAKATMQSAQRLYERGFITYMRTDSTTLSEQAIGDTRRMIEQLYGKDYLPGKPRTYQTKVKNAQEAHEAIRPSGDMKRPEDLAKEVEPIDVRLYELIWKRTMACQMADARGSRTSLQVSDGQAVFQTSGKTIEFPGFLRAYVEGADDPNAELADKEKVLPPLQEGQGVSCQKVDPKEHTTQPPARYTEATLVKELESRGIGRPSTYASIMDTIQNRSYVVKQGNALVPTFTAYAVVQLMEQHFTDLVDSAFTARLEDDLDSISLGDMEAIPYLRKFYFGNGQPGLKDLVQAEIDPRESHTIVIGQADDGENVEVRIGRYGPYLEKGEQRAALPADLAPDELNVEKGLQLIKEGAEGPKELGRHPETDKPVYAKTGRFGPYVQLGDNDDDEKPKMKSLLPGMTLETLTYDQAMQLLSLPRTVGQDPDGVDIQADYGRYGPYVKRGTDTRSLQNPEDVFQVTVEGAMELLKQEKKRGRRTPTVLKELGKSPDTEEDIKMLEGRYGPYVTDGTTNASLPRGTDIETVTNEMAVGWLRERAARGGTKKKKAKKKASKKKASKKKASKKKTTKKKSSSKAASSKKKSTRKASKSSTKGSTAS